MKTNQHQMGCCNVPDLMFFSGSSHLQLANEIVSELNFDLGKLQLKKFPDKELYVEIQENICGKHVVIIQSIFSKPDEYLMELLLFADAAKRASAKSVCAFIPYYGYCRQDRKSGENVPIAAKLVADLLEKAGISHVVSMDLHSDQTQGFFNIPFENITAKPKLIDSIKSKLQLENLKVVSPDIGSIKYAKSFACDFGCDFAVINKKRINSENVKVKSIMGDVKEKNILLVDDICSTGSTLVSAAEECLKAGANDIFAAITHGIMAGDAIKLIEKSPIKKVFITNTIPQKESNKIVTVSIANIFASVIKKF